MASRCIMCFLKGKISAKLVNLIRLRMIQLCCGLMAALDALLLLEWLLNMDHSCSNQERHKCTLIRTVGIKEQIWFTCNRHQELVFRGLQRIILIQMILKLLLIIWLLWGYFLRNFHDCKRTIFTWQDKVTLAFMFRCLHVKFLSSIQARNRWQSTFVGSCWVIHVLMNTIVMIRYCILDLQLINFIRMDSWRNNFIVSINQNVWLISQRKLV